jgi:2-oxoglutarate dehydrogenase E2 component (dihydrolipoamide succinyltransferase)
MSRLRKVLAKRLKESQNNAASVTTIQVVDMGEIMQLRKDLGEEFQKQHECKLGILSFFVKAVCLALQQFPIVNSMIDESTMEIVHKDYVDISVAISAPRGLVVPVLRDVQNMSFVQIERAIADLAQRAQLGRVEAEEMIGGNFTISNGGVFGSYLSVPIINPPQSAILGMHNIITTPVVRGDQIVARPVMNVSMTYDHRLLDGREGAGFLKHVSDLLSDPRRMLLW